MVVSSQSLKVLLSDTEKSDTESNQTCHWKVKPKKSEIIFISAL